MKLSPLPKPFLVMTGLALVLLGSHLARAATETETGGGWLDKKASNWNQPGAAIPRSPAPKQPSAAPTNNWWTNTDAPSGPSIMTSSADEASYFERCKALLRPATLPQDSLVEQAGWALFGQAHIFGKLTVVMGMAAVDGMCRPMQYQAFVFVDDRFAGTLSPTPMNSRTDGALNTIDFVQAPEAADQDSAASLMVPYATFRRYQESDALCCPSATSELTYLIKEDDHHPLVVPQLPAQTSTPAPSSGTSS